MEKTIVALVLASFVQAATPPETSCGAASLHRLLMWEGIDYPIDKLTARLPNNPEGSALSEIVAAARVAGAQLQIERLPSDALPFGSCIVHLAPANAPTAVGHFVCVHRSHRRPSELLVFDPGYGLRVESVDNWPQRVGASGWIAVRARVASVGDRVAAFGLGLFVSLGMAVVVRHNVRQQLRPNHVSDDLHP